MGKKSSLFELVHSLTPSEKRYFRRYAARHANDREAHYLHLYEAYLALDHFSDDALLAQIGPASYLPQLAFYKTYLRKQLLRSLAEFHRTATPALEFRAQLDQVEILHHKGLDDWCLRLLRRLQKQALRYGALSIQLEVNEWQMRLARLTQSSGFRRRLETLGQEREALLRDLQTEGQLRALHDQFLYLITRNLQLRRPADREWADQLAADPLLADETQLRTQASRLYFFYCKVYTHQLRGDYPGVVRWYRKLVELHAADPDLIRQNEERYLKTMLGYLDACVEVGELDEFPARLQTITDFKASTPALEALVFKVSLHLRIRYALNTGQLHHSEALREETEAGFRQHERFLPLPTQLSFAYNLLVMGLLSERYRAALHWANFILQAPEEEVREDVRVAARVFQVILHLELENYDLIEFLHRSSRRYLHQKGIGRQFEQVVLNAVRKLADLSPGEQRARFQQLQGELADLLMGNEYGVLGHREVAMWLEGKV